MSLSRAWVQPPSAGLATFCNTLNNPRFPSRISNHRHLHQLKMTIDKSDPDVAEELTKVQGMPLEDIRKELKDFGKRPRLTMSDQDIQMLLVETRLSSSSKDKNNNNNKKSNQKKSGEDPFFAKGGKGKKDTTVEEKEDGEPNAPSKFEEEMKSNSALERFYNDLKEYKEKDSMKIVEEYVNDPDKARTKYEEDNEELLAEIDAVVTTTDVYVKPPTGRIPATQIPRGTEKNRDAYIDCAYGVDELSLLAACLNACTSSRSEASSLVSQIENHVKEELGDVSDGRSSSTTIIEEDDGIKGLKISIIKNEGVGQYSVAETVSLEELTSFCKRPSTFFEVPTKNACLDLFSELARVIQQIRGVNKRAIQVSLDSVVQVMAIVHILSTLGVNRISCSPLNVGNLDSDSLDMALIDELLVGMTVDRAALNNGSSSPLGVALLRVLTGADTRRQTKKREMVSVTTGRGASDSNPFGLTCIIGEAKNPDEKDSKPTSRRRKAKIIDDDDDDDDDDIGRIRERIGRVDMEPGAPIELIESELWKTDYVSHLETNIDDMTSEHLSFVLDLLFEKGAMDAWLVPIVMKKGRAAHTLHCLCASDGDDPKIMLETIFRHTTTLGVRCYVEVPRAKLYRNTVSVQTAYEETSRDGIVDVKVSTFKDGEVMSMKAEFDHCKVIAKETGTPLKFVSDAAVAAARAHIYDDGQPPPEEDPDVPDTDFFVG